MRKKDAQIIYSLLLEHYPDALDSPTTVGKGTAFEILILTILSAQTTDKAVLAIKKLLFSKYPTPVTLAKTKIVDVEKIIHSLGFYHAKARHIISAAKMIVKDFDGSIPQTMEGLLTIPGVGRKTANIVLYHALDKNVGIAVDTHVRRLAESIGFSNTNNVSIIERNLMAIFPQDQWGDLTDVLIIHGRACCTAKKPQCEICPISKYCRYFQDLRKN